MHKLMIIVLFTALVIGIVSLLVVMSQDSSAAVKPPVIDETTMVKPQNPPGTISGLKNPELIPDRAAYLILFRLIANRNTPEEKNRVESHIRDMLNIGCKSCGTLKESGKVKKTEGTSRTPEQESADINAVFATAEEFNQQITLLDNQAKEAKENRRSNPLALSRLTALQAQKNAFIEGKAAVLIQRLSPTSRSKLQSFINERLKQKIKIVPSQPVSPS